MPLTAAPDLPALRPARIGIDLVQVSAVERSIADFGARFTHRLFAAGELRDSTVDGRLDARALAARFAAKEATIKAFDLSDAGIGWAQIEVRGEAGGAGHIVLTGRAAESVAATHPYEIAVAMTHERDLACAIVVALPASESADEGRVRARDEQHPTTTP